MEIVVTFAKVEIRATAIAGMLSSWINMLDGLPERNPTLPVTQR